MKNFLLMAAMLALVACAGSNQGPDARARQAGSMPRLGSDEVLSRFSALPAQTLAKGECGLFLWLKRDDAPLVFFQRSGSLAAEMIVDGSLRALTRDGAERPIGMSFFEKQNFVDDDLRVNLRIQVEADRSLQKGLKVPAGMVSIDTAEGWSAALPVAGAIGCK
ncbi:hypothetical protein [Kordiimonas aestuarii]|uniref:hypothetical protein n=1 Tax=Kordiimonas aestuarii TaxID=1005925 RepID=UPI0021D39412|nr:hypothetical protein [Kordiimonas aestuarii]